MRVLPPTSTIKLYLRLEPNGKVQKFFTQECARRMDKYVPKESGVLRNTAQIGADYVKYVQPYAHYQYKGISRSGKPLNYKTPGTGSYWDKRMWSTEKEMVVQAVQDYVEGK